MKKVLVALFILSTILALAASWPRLRRYQQEQSLRQATRFLAAGELAKASLSARRVLQLNPKNADSCVLLSELAELCRSPAAVDWCQRAAELEPSLGNKLHLAGAALRFQHPPYTLASQTLSGLQRSGAGIPAFHVLSAELALKLDRPAEAAAHFQEASRLEPNNELHRLNLAVLNLQCTNRDKVEAARNILERLSTNHDLAPLALRWRIAEKIRLNDYAAAKTLSHRLLADPRATIEDRLQHLSILQASKDCEFTNSLHSIQVTAVTNAVDLYSTCEWMGRHGFANEALVWLAGLDVRSREMQPVPLATANLLLLKEDWDGLETLLRDKQWPDLEFLRFAFLARAARGGHHDVAEEANWRAALRASSGRLGALSLLLSLVVEWGHDPQDLLWQIGEQFPREQWALLELERRYQASGNTRGLNKVYSAKIENVPGAPDLTNRNNFAVSSMLLRINLGKAYDIARDLYKRLPEDPIIASTYGYSLHLQGRTEEGLAVFGKLKPESVEIPSVALYYGVLLSAAGRPYEAERYLALAQAAHLLPEENQLLSKAKSRTP